MAFALRLRDLAVQRLAFAEKQWQKAIEKGDLEGAKEWEKKVEKAEEKVNEAKAEVKEAKEEVQEAEARRGGVSTWNPCCTTALQALNYQALFVGIVALLPTLYIRSEREDAQQRKLCCLRPCAVQDMQMEACGLYPKP